MEIIFISLVLPCIIIFVILLLKNDLIVFQLEIPNYDMFCKMFIITKLAFPLPPLIMLFTGL